MKSAVCILAVALLAPTSERAFAAESPWQRGDGLSYRVIAATAADGVVWVGVQLRPDRGYKVFWRSPGTFGLPTTFDLAGSQNVSTATVEWPVPRRIKVDGLDLTSIGYDREVVFPIAVTPSAANRAADLRVKADFGVCGEVCIPGALDVSLSVPANDVATNETRELLERFRARVPRTAPSKLTATQDGDALVVEVAHTDGFKTPDIFVDAGTEASVGSPTLRLSADKRLASFRVPLEPPTATLSETIHIVIVDEQASFTADVALRR